MTATLKVADVRACLCPSIGRSARFAVVHADAGLVGVGEASQSYQDRVPSRSRAN